MCRIVEDLIDSEKKEIVLRLLSQNILSREQIAESVGLDVEIVNILAESQN